MQKRFATLTSRDFILEKLWEAGGSSGKLSHEIGV
jgi:hypothetical protein